MPKGSPYSDWRVILLDYCIRAGYVVVPKPVRTLFAKLFLTISPSVPVDLRRGAGPGEVRYIFAASYVIALFFCLFVTGFLCWVEGTLQEGDPSRRAFLEDGWNLFFYAAVCPTYVGLSCALVAVTIRKWSDLADFADQTSGATPQRRSCYRVYSVFAGALILCTVFITNYMQDILHPTAVAAAQAKVYWFMEAAVDNVRIPNRVGYYYISLNFALLFITLLGIACFLSLSAEVFRIGNAKSVDKIHSFDVLHVQIRSFTTAYILAKGLAATYLVNYFVWAVSPLGQTDNLLVAQIALTIVGGFFVAVPRQYVEMRWYELWQQSGKSFEFAETRPPRIKAVASFLDAAFIALIFGSWKWDAIVAKWISIN